MYLKLHGRVGLSEKTAGDQIGHLLYIDVISRHID